MSQFVMTSTYLHQLDVFETAKQYLSRDFIQYAETVHLAMRELKFEGTATFIDRISRVLTRQPIHFSTPEIPPRGAPSAEQIYYENSCRISNKLDHCLGILHDRDVSFCLWDLRGSPQ